MQNVYGHNKNVSRSIVINKGAHRKLPELQAWHKAIYHTMKAAYLGLRTFQGRLVYRSPLILISRLRATAAC